MLVLLHLQQVAAAAIDDGPGDSLLAAHGVDAHDEPAANIGQFEQLENGRDLVALCLCGQFAPGLSDWPGTVAPIMWIASLPLAASSCAQGLAVNRDELVLNLGEAEPLMPQYDSQDRNCQHVR